MYFPCNGRNVVMEWWIIDHKSMYGLLLVKVRECLFNMPVGGGSWKLGGKDFFYLGGEGGGVLSDLIFSNFSYYLNYIFST